MSYVLAIIRENAASHLPFDSFDEASRRFDELIASSFQQASKIPMVVRIILRDEHGRYLRSMMIDSCPDSFDLAAMFGL